MITRIHFIVMGRRVGLKRAPQLVFSCIYGRSTTGRFVTWTAYDDELQQAVILDIVDRRSWKFVDLDPVVKRRGRTFAFDSSVNRTERAG